MDKRRCRVRRNPIVLVLLLLVSAFMLSSGTVSAADGIVAKKTDCYADSFTPGFPGSLACNNSDTGNPWLSDSTPYPHWLVVNLTNTVVLTSVSLNCIGCAQGPAAGRVETWSGTAWVQIGTWTGNLAGANLSVPVTPTTTNKIRLFGTAGIASNFDEAFEIWTYGHAAPVPVASACGTLTTQSGLPLGSLFVLMIGLGLFLLILGAFLRKGSGEAMNPLGYVLVVLGVVIVLPVTAAVLSAMGC